MMNFLWIMPPEIITANGRARFLRMKKEQGGARKFAGQEFSNVHAATPDRVSSFRVVFFMSSRFRKSPK
jgi:hypothetical protein